MKWLVAIFLLLAAPVWAQTAIRPDQICPGGACATPDITWAPGGTPPGYVIGSTIPWRTDSSTTPTFAATDAAKTVELTNTGAITSTLPSTGGAGLGDGFGFTIQVGSGQLTLGGAQTINGQASIVIGPYQIAGISSRGGNWYAALGAPQGWNPGMVVSLTWGPGQNLSTAGLPMFNTRQTATVIAIRCTPAALAGGAATFKVYKAASGTALGSGTDLATGANGSCDANAGASTDQNFTLTTTALAAGDRVGVVATGAGWAASVGSGVVTIWYK